MAGAVDVYLGVGRGYVVVPIVARADLWATTSLYPAQTLPLSADAEELGLAVLNGMRRSEHARPQMLSQADRFWMALGCASYQEFCRNFVGVTVERRGYRLRLSRLAHDVRHGGYLVDERDSVELFRFATAEEIGDAAQGLLDRSQASVPSETHRITTLDGVELSYVVPAFGLVDRGDAGGDFYRVYALEGDAGGWVGFLIGERYASLEQGDIRARWREEYGSDDSFEAVREEDSGLRVSLTTPDLEVRARLWETPEGWLEARYELPLGMLGSESLERARRLLGGVLDSCEVA